MPVAGPGFTCFCTTPRRAACDTAADISTRLSEQINCCHIGRSSPVLFARSNFKAQPTVLSVTTILAAPTDAARKANHRQTAKPDRGRLGNQGYSEGGAERAGA